jgi:GntR family transcriptional regulator
MSGHRGKTVDEMSPRHAEIARDLRDAIMAGSLAVGSVLPTELALCARYGVSRHSVRIAIADLAEAGLVARRKRFGTVVLAAQPARRYRHTVASVDDLVQYGADHVRSVRKTGLVTAGAALALDLGCVVGTRWFCVASLRFDPSTGPEPLGVTEVYVDPAYDEVGAWARQSPGRLISSFVAERTGRPIARIKQDVTAMLIDRRLAALLVVAAGSPALRIVRHYLDDAGRLLVGSVSVHPASRFRVSSTLERVG